MLTQPTRFTKLSQNENGDIKDAMDDDCTFCCLWCKCKCTRCCTTCIKEKDDQCYAFEFLNFAAVIAHLGLFAFFSVAYSQLEKPIKYNYTEVYTGWEESNNGTCQVADRRLNATRINKEICVGPRLKYNRGIVDLGLLIIFFHVLSFLFQAIAGFSSYNIFRCKRTDKCNLFKALNINYDYVEGIKKGQNLLRYIEYSASASIMLVAIAFLNGITDLNLVACITVLTAATQICGLVAEYLLTNDDDVQGRVPTAWLLHVTGWMQFLCAYGVILKAFFVAAFDDTEASEEIDPPPFVYAIVLGIMGLYASFGFVQLAELSCISFERCCKECPYRNEDKKRINFQCKEITYVFLSLLAKTFLGLLLFINVLFASD